MHPSMNNLATSSPAVIISAHAFARAGERLFPEKFLTVAEAAAVAVADELRFAVNKACSMTALFGQQIALKIEGRKFNVDLTGNPQVATDVVIGDHTAVIGMIAGQMIPTVVTIKPCESHLKRSLKAKRSAKRFLQDEE